MNEIEKFCRINAKVITVLLMLAVMLAFVVILLVQSSEQTKAKELLYNDHTTMEEDLTEEEFTELFYEDEDVSVTGKWSSTHTSDVEVLPKKVTQEENVIVHKQEVRIVIEAEIKIILDINYKSGGN